MLNIAAIDMGSNAIRMILGRLTLNARPEALENLRLPVRLGQDAFTVGRFSEETMQSAVDAFLRLRDVARTFGVSRTRAVATSAMREAANGPELVARLGRKTGFGIEIINGEEEARLIHLAITKTVDLRGRHAMLIDIGGGSVEVTHSDGENILSTHCYRTGTVRMLKRFEALGQGYLPPKRLIREYMTFARDRIDHESLRERVDACVGTGGNIEELGRLRKRLLDQERDDLITADELAKLLKRLSEMSVEERMSKLGLRPDRADVILPATVVLYMLVRGAGIREVLIPRVGLKDGVLIEMAQEAAQPKSAGIEPAANPKDLPAEIPPSTRFRFPPS
jgi:exopolyphosphatase/guanosine-5'-triphosphate,3'-diphosphate pyrophosphatase